MKTPEQYHQEYPIGSRWLLPVYVCHHHTPEHDDYDPRPIGLRSDGNLIPIHPKTSTLDTLIPADPKTHNTEHPISVTLHLTSTQYAKLCTALLSLQK